MRASLILTRWHVAAWSRGLRYSRSDGCGVIHGGGGGDGGRIFRDAVG